MSDSQIKIFQIPAVLEGVSPLKDGGMSLRFHTNEVKSSHEKASIMEFYQAFGWLQFSDQSIHAVPKEAPVREAGDKTPSQRLRSTLYVLWQERYGDMTFDEYYNQQMEKIINRIKQELPDR